MQHLDRDRDLGTGGSHVVEHRLDHAGRAAFVVVGGHPGGDDVVIAGLELPLVHDHQLGRAFVSQREPRSKELASTVHQLQTGHDSAVLVAGVPLRGHHHDGAGCASNRSTDDVAGPDPADEGATLGSEDEHECAFGAGVACRFPSVSLMFSGVTAGQQGLRACRGWAESLLPAVGWRCPRHRVRAISRSPGTDGVGRSRNGGTSDPVRTRGQATSWGRRNEHRRRRP